VISNNLFFIKRKIKNAPDYLISQSPNSQKLFKHFIIQAFKHFQIMLLSMTGYGRSTQKIGEQTVVVEIKSLNSKYLDLKLRLPQGFNEKEMELRKILTVGIKRGKADINVDIQEDGVAKAMTFNKELFRAYYRELSELHQELAPDQAGDLMQAIMRIPSVTAPGENIVDDSAWTTIKASVQEALEKFNQFRKSEGDVTEADFRLRVKNIGELLTELVPHETPRLERLRGRFTQHLTELRQKKDFDENRLEQEILFYIEKLDLTEEKVRLEQHCEYFIQQLNDTKTDIKGKKLNFIAQEMGREINTIGSKANSADIQRIVVQMKDELEKIKEQTSNIL